jgi:hypothetical protein
VAYVGERASVAEAALSAEGTIRSTRFEEEGRRVRRTLLRNMVLATILLAGLGIGFQRWVAPPELRGQHRSSFSTRADGFRGVFEMSRRLGYTVDRHLGSFGSLPKPATHYTLLILDPLPAYDLLRRSKTALGDAQFRALRLWLEAGGQAVIAMPGRSSYQFMGAEVNTDINEFVERLAGPKDLVPGLLGEVAPVASWTPMRATLEGAGELAGFSQPVPELEDNSAQLVASYLRRGGESGRLLRFVDTSEEDLELLAFNLEGKHEGMTPVLNLGEDRAIALTKAFGAGKLWLTSTAYPFTNMALARGEWSGPVYAIVDSATERGKRTLIFDEYAHGLWARKGMLAVIAESDLRYPLAVVLLLGLLIGWRGSVRLGAPVPVRTVPRRAKEEFVISLADLALRAGRHGAAARWLHEAYRDRIPPPGASPSADRLAARVRHPFTELELRDFSEALSTLATEHARRGPSAHTQPVSEREA